MKLKTRKATNSYTSDDALAKAVFDEMGKQVKYALEENRRAGMAYGMAGTKDRLAELIRERRAELEERGFGKPTNREVLDSLGNSLAFKSKEERGAENAMKGFVRAKLAETVQIAKDKEGNVIFDKRGNPKYEGVVELPNGRYRDLFTNKIVSLSNPDVKNYKALSVFTDIGFVPGKTELVYVDGAYRYWGTNGKTYEITFDDDYSEGGSIEVKEI